MAWFSMPSASEVFVELVGAMLARYCRQNRLPPLPDSERNAIGARLWVMISVRGIPLRIPEGESNSRPEMKADEVAPLVATILENCSRADDLAVPVRQLIKACFQAERSQCRESYKETRSDGQCRRQQLERVRSRVSGTHCVDCPYWNELNPDAHERFLVEAWCGNPEEFTANREVFLPEDFRELRGWLRDYKSSERT